MWILFWKRYPLSKLASFVSFVGMFMRYAGVVCLFSSLIPAGIICILIGAGLHFGAETIAKSKTKKVMGAQGKKSEPVAPKAAASQPASAPQPKVVPPVQKSEPASPAAPSESGAADRASALRRPCPNCGTFVPGTNKFCSECGSQLIK